MPGLCGWKSDTNAHSINISLCFWWVQSQNKCFGDGKLERSRLQTLETGDVWPCVHESSDDKVSCLKSTFYRVWHFQNIFMLSKNIKSLRIIFYTLNSQISNQLSGTQRISWNPLTLHLPRETPEAPTTFELYRIPLCFFDISLVSISYLELLGGLPIPIWNSRETLGTLWNSSELNRTLGTCVNECSGDKFRYLKSTFTKFDNSKLFSCCQGY